MVGAQTVSALEYVLSSSTLFCCHCTEDNCGRCQGVRMDSPRMALTLLFVPRGQGWGGGGVGTDAQGLGLHFPPFDSCPGPFCWMDV